MSRGGAPKRGRAPAGQSAAKGRPRAAAAPAFVAQGGSKRRRGDSGSEPDSAADDVTLLYRRPSRRGIVVGAGAGRNDAHVVSSTSSAPTVTQRAAAVPSVRGGGGSGAVAGPSPAAANQPYAVMRLAKGRTAPEVMLWRRCIGQRNLIRSLQNCGLAPAPPQDDDKDNEDGEDPFQRQQSGAAGANKAAGRVGAAAVSTQHDRAMLAALSALSEDRIRAAVHSLVDLKALAIYVDPTDAERWPVPTSGSETRKKESGEVAPAVGSGCGWWVRHRFFDAAVALARLCDAAVPTVHPALVTTDALALAAHPHRMPGGEDEEVLPMPVVMRAAERRLRALTRLWQLRFTHGVLVPALHRCGSVADLNAFFLPPAAGGGGGNGHVDSFVAFPALASARHRAEDLVLAELVGRLNAGAAVDAAAWGPSAALPLLAVSNGAYVAHHGSREPALAQLLAEEDELYGLPPFLRSVRLMAGGHGLAGPGPRAISSHASSGLEYAGEHLLFPTLCSLDRRQFQALDAMQGPLLQEELIGLAMKHCAFGLVAGDADQVLLLLKEWSEHQAQGRDRERAAAAAKHEHSVKGEDDSGDGDGSGDEGEEESGGERPAAVRRRRDPMAPYARETAVLARQQRRRSSPTSGGPANDAWRSMCRVDWLCEDRWAPAASGVAYYGLVYAVVLRSELLASLDGATPGAPLDADQVAAGGSGAEGRAGGEIGAFQEAMYYISAVVELSR